MRNKKELKKVIKITGMLLAGVAGSSFSVHAEPVVSKTIGAYADVNTWLNVRKGAGTEYEITAQLPKDGYCRVLRREGDWAYIVSDKVQGYVYEDYLITGVSIDEYLEKTALKAPIFAEKADKEEKVLETAATLNGQRQEIVNYALQFVGNPYVWGGTSLTDGADCSGFVQTIYKDFGIVIPRVAADQADAGTKISVEEAQPGDLIFYADNGEIYHVVMYIGNGKVVHASSAATGIKVSDVNWEHAVSAARLL